MGAQSQAQILLVEDDPGVARLEQLRLERAGYVVRHRDNGRRGVLERIAAGGIELIVLDQQLTRGTERPGPLPPDQGGRPRCAGHPGHRPSRRATAGRGAAGGGARLRAQDPQLSQPPRADREPGDPPGEHRARPGRIAHRWPASTRSGAASSSTRSPAASASSRPFARPRKTCG